MAVSCNLEARSARSADREHFKRSTRRALLRLLERIDHIAGLEIARREHGLRVHALELIDLAALDAVVLDLQHAALLPLAALAELHVAHDGLERGLADVVGERVVVEALGGLDGIPENLDIGIAPGPEVVAERVDAFRPGPRLVGLEERLCAREHH